MFLNSMLHRSLLLVIEMGNGFCLEYLKGINKAWHVFIIKHVFTFFFLNPILCNHNHAVKLFMDFLLYIYI